MFRTNDVRAVGLAIVLLLLTGCVNQSRSLDTEQTACCLPETPAIYKVTSLEVPSFMKDMVEVSLHLTMQTLGYTNRGQNEADLLVSASYEQTDFANNQKNDSAMLEASNVVDPKQFVAKINIQIKDTSGKIVWQGAVQRLHTVGPGEYTHRGNAANSIATSLVELISTPSEP